MAVHHPAPPGRGKAKQHALKPIHGILPLDFPTRISTGIPTYISQLSQPAALTAVGQAPPSTSPTTVVEQDQVRPLAPELLAVAANLPAGFVHEHRQRLSSSPGEPTLC